MTWRARLMAWLAVADTPIRIPGAERSQRTRVVAGALAFALLAFELVAAWRGLWWSTPLWSRWISPGLVVAALLALGAGPRTLGLWGPLRPSLRFWLTGTLVIGAVFALLLVLVFLVARHFDAHWLTFPPGYHGEIRGDRCFGAIVLSPLIEEPIWRLALVPALVAAFGPGRTILIDGAGFAALHFAAGVAGPDNFLGGYIFAWVYLRSGSIWLPLVLHATGNACFILGQSLAWRLVS
jgi:uncharacterized protein